ncbi:MAG TPA: peptidoglycan DD-metalloendopeptidase family protein [Candidatus Limnocylindria bacterium]
MGAPRIVRGGGGGIRGLRTTIVVLAALALFLGQQLPAYADDPLADAMRKKQELERAVQVSRQNTERYKEAANQFDAAVRDANTRIGDLAAKQAKAQSEAENLGFEIQIAEEQLQLVTFQLNETKALAESLVAQVNEQNRQLVKREDLYAKHLKTTYRQAQISPLQMLLSSGSLSEFANRVQAMVLINRQDVQLAGEIKTLRADTTRKQDDAAAKTKEIGGLQDQITEQRAHLAAQKAEFERLVAQAQVAINSQAALRANAANDRNSQLEAARNATGETANLNRQLEQAEAQLATLAAQLAARSGLGTFNGTKLPTWPLSGAITSGFGARWGGFHNGLDIAAPMYSAIRAAAPGRVVTVGKPYLAYGDTATVVIIAHGNNFSTLYGHLDDSRPPIVSVGQYVQAGQVIAFEGMTGWTTGPHLHFMTIVNGRAVDPLPYLP